MNAPITITEVVGRAVQGMTKPFLCKAGFFDYDVKGAYAGLDSLGCEWGENIEHRMPNIERRNEEKKRLAEVVGTRRGGLPPVMRDALCDFRSLALARSAFRIAVPMK